MNVKSSLVATNPWWNDDKINEQFLLGRKRNEFNDIIEKINNIRGKYIKTYIKSIYFY